MRIIISPAKKMNVNTEKICGKLQGMSYEELKKLWKCNDQIAEQNVERLRYMDLHRNLTPAILAYEGIQYQYMAPSVFTEESLDYVQEHLCILSGFYGIIKPLDGVVPYRLEMQAKLKIENAKDLYAYWGKRLAEYLFAETDCIVNLASKEYSICISKHLPDHVRMITCVFGEEKDGKIIEKGTMCKMARGEMVRFMAEHQIEDVEAIKAFDRLDYHYSEERSDETIYVFIKETANKES